MTGEGLEEATSGIDTIVHCASNPRDARRTDVGGTERLLRAAVRAGVWHFVYISIVGVGRNPFPYYRAKLDTERLVKGSPVPRTILRATQFHHYIHGVLGALNRVPLFMPVPKAFLLQPIDVSEVANRLVELALSGPSGRVENIGGPEVRTVASLAGAYLKAMGHSKRVLGVPLPGKAARAVRGGAQLAPESAWGTLTWEEFLSRTVNVEDR